MRKTKPQPKPKLKLKPRSSIHHARPRINVRLLGEIIKNSKAFSFLYKYKNYKDIIVLSQYFCNFIYLCLFSWFLLIYLQCWNNCDQQLGPFALNINSAMRQGSLVLTDIGWDQAITNASKQCLVTWEVSGGGLMGNLLTDSSTVELSLWPDTVYHVQVTCKHKVSL